MTGKERPKVKALALKHSPRIQWSTTSQKSQAEERNLGDQCVPQLWEKRALENNCPQQGSGKHGFAPFTKREVTQRG